MRVLVTGGAGFIGSRLIETLLDRGHEVLNYDLKASNLCGDILGDITDEKKVYGAVKGSDVVYHLAAVANLNHARREPDLALETNVQGTYVVAKTCSDLRVPLFFTSTACVYGNTPNHPSTEESICVPTDIYGLTKLVGEDIVRGLHRKQGLTYNIMRFGTSYGPGMRGELAIYVFILQALCGFPLTVHGTGKQTRCMIYIDDLVEAAARILEMGVTNETLNLASDEELSVLDYVTIILEELGKPKDLFEHVADRPGQIMKEQLDVSKAARLLDWAPQVGFRQGIKKTIKWFKEARGS